MTILKPSIKLQIQVTTDLEQAARQNFYFGAKMVRGAYIEQERARAAALGYEDPTNPSFEATTEMYNKVFTECLRRIKVRFLLSQFE
jgi:proline dehydrogenase